MGKKFKPKFKLNFKFKSILQKMWASFSVVIFFILIIMLVTVNSVQKVDQETDELVQETIPLTLKVEKLSKNFVTRNQLAYEYLATGNEDVVFRFEEKTEESEALEAEILQDFQNEDLEEAIKQSKAWTSNTKTAVIAQKSKGRDETAEESLKNLTPIATETLSLMDQSVAALETEMGAAGAEVSRLPKEIMITTLALGILSIILSIVISWRTSRSIALPVRQMTERLEEFIVEDFTSEPLEIKTIDEIGQLATALNTTQDYLIGLMQNIKETASLLVNSSDEFLKTEEEIRTGAQQISATMQELASGAEAQANTASNLAGDMDSFVDTTKETLQYGNDITQASEEIVEKANEGNELMDLSNEQMGIVDSIVQEAVKQMETLDQQTNEISKLVDIINNIATQTNLLALNASIEAARAGDQGRGFAVVADEVRKLAEEVASSVSEITNYVNRVQEDAQKVAHSLKNVNAEVEVGSIHIQATGNNISEITKSINELQKQNEQMAINLNNVSKKSQEMNTLIDEIASVSQESAAGVEETSSSVEEINSSMEDMNIKSEGLANLSYGLDALTAEVKTRN